MSSIALTRHFLARCAQRNIDHKTTEEEFLSLMGEKLSKVFQMVRPTFKKAVLMPFKIGTQTYAATPTSITTQVSFKGANYVLGIKESDGRPTAVTAWKI